MNVTEEMKAYFRKLYPNARHIIVFDNRKELSDVVDALEPLPYSDVILKVLPNGTVFAIINY